jgi:hypothetical protein
MAKRQVKAGSTSVILGDVFLQDSSKQDGSGLPGIVFNTAGLTCYYHRNTGSTDVAVTLANMTLGTFTASGFKEVNATTMPGIYSFCPPDLALAAGAQMVTFYFKGATNLAVEPLDVELTATDNQDAVRGGMTALPNANAAAANGLLVNGVNVGTVTLAALTVSGATVLTGNLSCAAGVTITQSATNASALVVTGNGSGDAVFATGGTTGNGATFAGGATSGYGVRMLGNAAPGLYAAGGGAFAGIYALGGMTGAGLQCVGGATSGDGAVFTAAAGNGNGVTFAHAGSGKDLNATTTPLTLTAGVVLAPAGLDAVVVEAGLNARQALSINTAVLAGVLSGAAGTSIVIFGAGVATQRLSATVDSSGDRIAIVLSPPA